MNKKMYKKPQTETVKLSTGDMMQSGVIIGGSPSPGPIDAPIRNNRPL